MADEPPTILETSRDPYERDPTPEEDLWFLPGPPEDAAPTDPPWPVADRRPLIDPRAWHAAEARLAPELARAAASFGALDERLRRLGQGGRHRLALREVARLSWASGARLPVERIAQYEVLRLSMAGDDALDLATASWALRRLTGGPWPLEGLRAFLGRTETPATSNDTNSVSPRHPVGDEFKMLAADWMRIQAGMAGAHPLSQAAVAWFSWRAFGLSGPGDLVEGAVVAARVGGTESRGGTPFLPVATGDFAVYNSSGDAETRLRRWYEASHRACLDALQHLDRLESWRENTIAATADMSGRTPGRLINALFDTPLLSAEMAAHICRVSRAAASRNLTEFERRGLIREYTGQGRFRFWGVES